MIKLKFFALIVLHEVDWQAFDDRMLILVPLNTVKVVCVTVAIDVTEEFFIMSNNNELKVLLVFAEVNDIVECCGQRFGIFHIQVCCRFI